MANSSTWTIRKFLERAPLYTPYPVDLPRLSHDLFPVALLRPCSVCGGERNFRLPEVKVAEYAEARRVGKPGPALRSHIYGAVYTCTDCGAFAYSYWLSVDVEEENVSKVGQSPPPSIGVDRELSTALGADTELYKKALVSVSQGYGIGACAYLRRVLEHQVGPFLQIVREQMVTEKASDASLQEIDDAIKSKDGDTRTHILYKYAPASLLVEGENPLKLLYEDLSGGIHVATEAGATQLAVRWMDALAYVVRKLVRDRDERRQYAETVRAGRAERSTSSSRL